ncbi:MAG: lysophospholipid acyltransferase family protein [Candidatus Ozemobacteraceae bacterium]
MQSPPFSHSPEHEKISEIPVPSSSSNSSGSSKIISRATLGPLLTDLGHRAQALSLDLLARLTAKLGAAGRRRLSRFPAWLAHDVLRIRRAYIRETVAARLNLDKEASENLTRRIYLTFFENALNMASAPYRTPEDLFAGLEVRGREHLDAARAESHGFIVVCAHLGYWELAHHWLAYNGYKITSVVRRQNNRHVDAWMEFMRHAHGGKTTDSGFGFREVLRALKAGRVLGLMSDQNAGDRGLFVPFLGEVASTVVGPALISRKMGCPIVPLAMFPRRGKPPLLIFERPIRPGAFPPGREGERAITQTINDLISRWIREYPEHWFWFHRRWKSRPSSSPNATPEAHR